MKKKVSLLILVMLFVSNLVLFMNCNGIRSASTSAGSSGSGSGDPGAGSGGSNDDSGGGNGSDNGDNTNELPGDVVLVADQEILNGLTKFAETWSRNWNFEGHSVDSRFNGDYGFWDYTETTFEPWLFDRVSVGFYLYQHTGQDRWRQRAVSDLAWYAARIDSQGIFTPKGQDDTKYSYVTPFLTFEKLTGDQRYRPVAQRIYNAWLRDFPDTFAAVSNSLWTEREIGLALDAAVSYYELTGSTLALQRATALVNQWTVVSQQTGAPLVTVDRHEGGGGSQLVTSPWMSALYFQAARRYYNITQNPVVLLQVSRYADFLERYGFVDGAVVSPSLAGVLLPYYLCGPSGPYRPETPNEGDMGHALDVAGLMKFAISAKKIRGEATNTAEIRYAQLRQTALRDFGNWTRSTTYLPKYRLVPARKFNWLMRGYNEMTQPE